MCWKPGTTSTIRHQAGHSRENLRETANGDDDVTPEVAQELNRLKVLGRPHQAPRVDELVPKRDVYSQKSCELLDPRLAGEGRESSTLCGKAHSS